MVTILVLIGTIIFFYNNIKRQKKEGVPIEDIRIFDTEYSKEPTDVEVEDLN